MKTFLFVNAILTALNIFIIIYAYSLSFFPAKWKKKIKQDTLVGMVLIFLTMCTCFLWVIYIYYEIFY
jgi:uncharacterized membrane protein